MWSPTEGRARLTDSDGQTLWADPEWNSNKLLSQGEESILDVWLREQKNPAKYLCLLTSAPKYDDKMTALVTREIRAPGSDGYFRLRMKPSEWAVPLRDLGGSQMVAVDKIFGPAENIAWRNITHIALVTTPTGYSGKLLSAIPLSGMTHVLIGQALRYNIRGKVL